MKEQNKRHENCTFYLPFAYFPFQSVQNRKELECQDGKMKQLSFQGLFELGAELLAHLVGQAEGIRGRFCDHFSFVHNFCIIP